MGARPFVSQETRMRATLLELAADPQPVVVLTAAWHGCDTRWLVERLVCHLLTR